MDVDFYRYFIGREDQSVNEKVMIKRLDQQIFVTKTMIDMYQLKDIGSKKLRQYMLNYLAIMMTVSSILCIRSKNKENLEKKKGFAGLWTNKKARTGLIGGIIALCLVLVFLTVYMTSYDHYVAKGKALDTKEDYTGALVYYNRAIEKNDTKTKAKILAANDYITVSYTHLRAHET